MIIVDEALRQRAKDGNPIRVALIGAGYMGAGMVRQMLEFMTGFDVVAICNRTLETAEGAYQAAGIDQFERVDAPSRLDELIAAGQRAVTTDPEVVCGAESVEVVFEVTGEVEYGAQVAVTAIDYGKHLVLLNAELDATVGPILKVYADRQGVVMTNSDGDEPGVAMNMVRFVESIGYKPVLAGNIKGFLDPYRNPDTQAEFARRYGQKPKMITSFADGTKLSMEATVLANATGFGVANRAMTGHRCSHVREVLDLYQPEELFNKPLVDYVLGAEPGSGAFVLGYDDDSQRASYMDYFKMGRGPLYLFYRPFHLTHLEAPLSVARAVLFGDATITPKGPPVTSVLAVAKRDLRSGEILDGIGGYACYGMIDNANQVRSEGLLPMGITEGCRMRQDVGRDSPLTFDDVEIPEGRIIDRLRLEQDAHFYA